MSQAQLRDPGASAQLVPGEFAFTSEDLERIAALLYAQSGIVLTEAKANLIYSRLAKRLRALRLPSFAAYCKLVASDAGADERATMLNALTTNVTRFYREPHHFTHLRDQVLLPALPKLRAGGRMRLWSAACSSGQEPYSMALTVLSVLPEAAELDIKILATDIDSKILAQAREGAYTAEHVEPIPAELRARWMARDPADRDTWRVSPTVRSLVTFNEMNLIGQWPAKGPFDAIFCRNVVIYFDEPTQEKVWSRFQPLLGPEGRLYIGHSERVSSAVSGLTSDGLTVYRKSSKAFA